MTAGRVAAVLFDLDGTLIDTFHLYLESYRRALEPFLGYRPTIEEFAAHRPASERRFLSGWIGSPGLPIKSAARKMSSRSAIDGRSSR
ncbi:MAG TPA: HAD hydrolase-like protein, partial [Longimicrobiaceae bacterium]|nr:HAD hydrolase-like protein [Longimicrobiaceae bacterium]